MAKLQRSVQLPARVYELAEAFEAQSGAKFNRQALAAFLQFYYCNPAGPDHVWMRMAVAVEKGELPLGKVGEEVAKKAMVRAVGHSTVTVERVKAGTIHPDAGFESAKQLIVIEARKRLAEWEAVLRLADDPIDALIARWQERPAIRHVSPAWDDPEERARRGLPPISGETAPEQGEK